MFFLLCRRRCVRCVVRCKVSLFAASRTLRHDVSLLAFPHVLLHMFFYTFVVLLGTDHYSRRYLYYISYHFVRSRHSWSQECHERSVAATPASPVGSLTAISSLFMIHSSKVLDRGEGGVWLQLVDITSQLRG